MILGDKQYTFLELNLTYELPRATKNGDLRMVKLLLSKLSWRNTWPYNPIDSIQTSLRNAAKRGHTEMVDALFGAVPSNMVSQLQLTEFLLVAAKRKHWDVARVLLSHGM